MEMRAAVLYGFRDIRIEDVPTPKFSPDEVLIKVKAAGICGTDIHIYKGEWKTNTPIILGHEFSGVVAETGHDVRNLEIRAPVVAEPNMICGSCYFCRMSERNYFCENLKAIGVSVDGAFAEYVKIKAENVYEITEDLNFDEAALIEPLACCVRGIDQAKIRAGDTVAIIGAGPIGLILLQLAKLAGASIVIQTDMNDARLKLASDLGADYTINIREEDPVKAIKSLTKGYGVDVAIEAVGSPEAITQAMKVTRRGGRLNIFGVSPQDAVWEVKPFELYDKELTITTSYRSPFTFQRAVKIALSGKVKLKPLISHIFKLEDIHRAFEVADKKLEGAIKVLVKP
ncbi:zinc-dependent alcohol dehydrogenase family protein [Candidatus Bathyarchaeota archaeon]|nr:zinc-dependent alcohol dehydrogenase family protein [Candidatus Bathyarchaeota archaeon]